MPRCSASLLMLTDGASSHGCCGWLVYSGNIEVDAGGDAPVDVLFEAIEPYSMSACEAIVFVDLADIFANDFMGHAKIRKHAPVAAVDCFQR